MARVLGLEPEFQAFERYLLTIRRTSGHLRYTPATARTYTNGVAHLLRQGPDLVTMLARATAPEQGPTARWNTLRSATLAWAAWKSDDDMAARLREIKPPPITYRETKPPSTEQWDHIVTSAECLPEPRRSAVLLLAVSGLRIGEVFLLTRRQVELGITNREIAIYQKGSRTRDWAPSTRDRALLAQLIRKPGWNVLRDVFDTSAPDVTDRQRYAAAYHEVRKTLRSVCVAAGVDYVRPHRYRHAVAGDLVRAGGSIIDAQKALGHADSRTTDKFYLHSSAEQQIALKDRAANLHRRTP